MTFRSRVFKTREDRDRWARDFNEAGRRNYAYLKMRKDAQLSTSSPNAGAVGSAPTFDVGDKKRRRRKKTVVSKSASHEAGVKHAFVAATLGAGLGVLAVYDALRARGHKGDVERVRLAITTGRLVDSRRFVKRIDPKIRVLTTGAEIDRALMSEPNLSAARRKAIVDEVAEDLKAGRNAYALVGERAAYIFAPARTSAGVLGHEIGHVLDFRKRGLNYRNQGRYEGGLAAAVWKPSHESSVMSAEREAWRRSPRKDKGLERAALGSYEKSFHGRRAFMAGSASALAFTVAMLKAAAEMTAGEYERETSASGVTDTRHSAHRPHIERRTGKSGVPMWIRYSKNLQSPSTRGFGDDRSGYEQRL